MAEIYTVKDKSVLDDDSDDEIDETNPASKIDEPSGDDKAPIGTTEFPSYKIASDYMNDEEIAAFKKPKKLKKLKKERLRKPIALEDDLSDGPSAKRPRFSTDEPEEGELLDESEPLKSFEDDLEKEMRSELEKAIRLRSSLETKPATSKFDEDSLNSSDDNEHDDQQYRDGGIFYDATAEYCRNLSHIAAESHSVVNSVKQEHDDRNKVSSLKLKRALDSSSDEDDAADDEGGPGAGQWNEVNMDEERKKPRPNIIKTRPTAEPILDQEPDLRRSVVNALRYAIKKGYLEKETKKLTGAKASARSNSEAQSYTIEEKFRDNDDKRRGRRDRPSSSSQVQQVKMPANFNPDSIQVKLEYTDDNGRELNAKEAFRYLSHHFHGKGPGLNKKDKRLKKLEREASIKQMTSADTPLGTASLMIQKQKELQQPYIELNGL